VQQTFERAAEQHHHGHHFEQPWGCRGREGVACQAQSKDVLSVNDVHDGSHNVC
jgi:hypothetical protein